MAELGIGIIGCGDGGLSNARALTMTDGARLAGLCDVDPVSLAAAKREFPGIPILCLGDLLAEPSVDLVVVATPDHEHLGPAGRALGAGKRVVVEKPIGVRGQLTRFWQYSLAYPGQLWVGEKYSHDRPIEALLRHRAELGKFLWGQTLYTMSLCDRILGPDGWRIKTRYNPVAGGLSHNFMTAVLVAGSPIARIRARGAVLTYEALKDRGGFDTVAGTLEFVSGALLDFRVCFAVRGLDSPLGHRTVSHTFQFENGALMYAPYPGADKLTVGGLPIVFPSAAEAFEWPGYNVGTLYGRMWRDLIGAINGELAPRHTVQQALNVADACEGAFTSARHHGEECFVSFQQ